MVLLILLGEKEGGNGGFMYSTSPLGIGEPITVALPKGTVPFSSNENWDSPPLIPSPILGTVKKLRDCPGAYNSVRRIY
jgi:hypothetical protein